MSEESKPFAPPPQMEAVRQLIKEHSDKGWDEAWKGSVTPWDAGQPQPALKELLESAVLDLPKTGTAFVPGCGRGYDAILIATTTGLTTLATDISSTAIKAAEEYAASGAGLDANLKFEVSDFFAMNDETFDVIYDYTFFVAIPPARRAEWGAQMRKLVKPGGYLITLIFPIAPYTELGPPFFVRPEHYDEVLGDGWKKVVDKVPENSLPTHVDRERLVVRSKL